jgi:AcrR family transcriptional regulator
MAARNKRAVPQEPDETSSSLPRERKDRILDVAIRLAEEGGFDNVRQRDVAEQAGVALGTLYKSFRGKEDLLSAALERQTDVLERRMERKPPQGSTELERVTSLFDTLTRAFCRKPNYARAVIRAMASGEPEVAANVVAYQSQLYRMIVLALRGPSHPSPEGEPTAEELEIALLLQQIWFAALVGWSAKLHGMSRAVEQVEQAARLLLAGAAALGRLNEKSA